MRRGSMWLHASHMQGKGGEARVDVAALQSYAVGKHTRAAGHDAVREATVAGDVAWLLPPPPPPLLLPSPAPRGLSPQPSISSGSDHSRSHMAPSCGTSCLRSMVLICSSSGSQPSTVIGQPAVRAMHLPLICASAPAPARLRLSCISWTGPGGGQRRLPSWRVCWEAHLVERRDGRRQPAVHAEHLIVDDGRQAAGQPRAHEGVPSGGGVMAQCRRRAVPCWLAVHTHVWARAAHLR